MCHFVPCKLEINSHQFARLYIENIYRLHGLSNVIISDRDTRFTSEFWRELFACLKTKLNLSTAYHPQTDGQSEIANRTIANILRAFVHKQHTDWLHYLPIAEFCYNNNVHTSTGMTPFTATYGFQPRTPITLEQPSPVMDVNTLLTAISDTHYFITEHLKLAKAFQKQYAKNQFKGIPQGFTEGAKVMLTTQHLTIRNQPCNKFKQRWCGPYIIDKKISDQVYKLQLPTEMKCHPVFHISKLKPYYGQASDVNVPIPIPNEPMPAAMETPEDASPSITEINHHMISGKRIIK